MMYGILANTVLLFHLAWILFMLTGFALTIAGLWRRRWLDEYWRLRTVHLGGILLVAAFAVTGRPCPITDLEVWLLNRHDPALGYEGSCIAHYLAPVIYPSVAETLILGATAVLAVFTLVVYIVRPPARVRTYITQAIFGR